MSQYFMLECLVPEDETALHLHNYPEIEGIDTWLSGSTLPVVPPLPIKLEWDPDTSGMRKSLYDATIPIMRTDLLQALSDLGIDNLDLYPVEIIDTRSGAITSDYSAFNVLGAVLVADLAKSKYADPSGRKRIDVDFDSLVIDAAAARGALLFRLAECVTGLVINNSIKQGLEKLGGFGLSFIPPEEWIG